MTAMTAEPIVPFPTLWEVDVAPAMSHDVAPLLVEGGVIVRCGQTLAFLDESSGEKRWSFALPADAGRGRFLVRAGDVIVLDVGIREPTLLAVTLDGREAWRAPIGGAIRERGVAVGHGQVYVLAFADAFDETLVAVDAARGAPAVRTHLGGGFAGLVADREGLLLRRHSVSDARGGLVRVDRTGGALRVLEPGPCWAVAVHGEGWVAITRGPDAEPRVARWPATGEAPQWSVPIENVGLGTDGEDVLALVAPARPPENPDACAVALIDATGRERWRRDPASDDLLPGELAFVGPLVYQSTGGAGALRLRRDGTPLGAYDGNGPPVARGDRLFLHTRTGALCASLGGLEG